MKKEKSCGVIVMTENGRFVLIRHLAGHWDFPKGHVEKGETEEETALREVEEETGLKVDLIPGFRETVSYDIKGKVEKEVVYFLGRTRKSEVTIQESEISDFSVGDYEETLGKITFQSNQELFKKAYTWLKDRGLV